MTTPHDTALEAAQAMAFGLAKLRYNESDKEASDLATQHTITAYLAALPVDEDAIVGSILPIIKHDWGGKDGYNASLHSAASLVCALRPYLRIERTREHEMPKLDTDVIAEVIVFETTKRIVNILTPAEVDVIAEAVVNRLLRSACTPQSDLAALLDSEGMVEKVAEAIHDAECVAAFSSRDGFIQEVYREQAKAALQTIKQEAGL